jgi:hypothetical protein
VTVEPIGTLPPSRSATIVRCFAAEVSCIDVRFGC